MESPLIFAVGILGNILSFLVILAPVPTFHRVYKKKSTESFQSLPYVVALLSAMLWLYYALLTKDLLLLSINAIGCLVESIYLAIYISYAPKQAMAFTVKIVCTLNVGIYGAMVAFLQLYMKGERRSTIAGGVGSAFALAVFVAPLTIIRQVIRTKSVEFLPFWLSFFLTLSAVVWFFYGLLMKDFFVATPNVLGLLFGLAQMGLHLVYKNPKKSGAVVSEIKDHEQQQQAAASTSPETNKDDQHQIELQATATPAVAPVDAGADGRNDDQQVPPAATASDTHVVVDIPAPPPVVPPSLPVVAVA